ncbi:response regulator [Consotaella salsifontis]|uniref:CheY chemotaxis protein or a CheY-like REC (Receiver) domain n=1 Tax=Consotaella salsifontis TaxID=1365950 RepID=A0A1T4SFD8_9HYPH|nr:response regulator [Consotaella salsifontis]SKA26883.1 CheY chemotaxis protein or a CheY-like REC (receiver) domain [Consotaella salsifontis]
MSETTLTGRAILVAEDEYFTATDLRQELTRLGASVIGPAPSLERAMDLIDAALSIDAAVLDINLGGETIFPAAERLIQRGVPFLFTTGYDQPMIPSRFERIPRCEKPVSPEKLIRTLASVLPNRPS